MKAEEGGRRETSRYFPSVLHCQILAHVWRTGRSKRPERWRTQKQSRIQGIRHVPKFGTVCSNRAGCCKASLFMQAAIRPRTSRTDPAQHYPGRCARCIHCWLLAAALRPAFGLSGCKDVSIRPNASGTAQAGNTRRSGLGLVRSFPLLDPPVASPTRNKPTLQLWGRVAVCTLFARRSRLARRPLRKRVCAHPRQPERSLVAAVQDA